MTVVEKKVGDGTVDFTVSSDSGAVEIRLERFLSGNCYNSCCEYDEGWYETFVDIVSIDALREVISAYDEAHDNE